MPTKVPNASTKQVKGINPDEFRKLRPDFKVLDDGEIQEDLLEIDEKAIEQETIDFSYVPIAGWRSKDNSIYGMNVISNNIQYASNKMNYTDIGLVRRVGEEPIVPKLPVKRKDDYYIKELELPSREVQDLGFGTPFRNSDFELNYDTQPLPFYRSELVSNTNLYQAPYDFSENNKRVPNVIKIPPSEMVLSTAQQGFLVNQHGDVRS